MLLVPYGLERKLVPRLGLPERHPEPQAVRSKTDTSVPRSAPGDFCRDQGCHDSGNRCLETSCTGARDRLQEPHLARADALGAGVS